jgi:hypothetical protein
MPLKSLLVQYSPAELLARLARRHGAAAHKIASGSEITDVAIDARWKALLLAHVAAAGGRDRASASERVPIDSDPGGAEG